MAFYSMAFYSIAPFGSLMAGTLASQIGTRWTLVLSGSVSVAGALWFARRLPEMRKILRPVYVRLGIVPEAALGVQQATALQAPENS
jgi:hypothetical protein